MYRKKFTAIMTAAIMLLYTLCGGTLQQIAAAEIDKTVYITVQPGSGTAGSSVPVTIDVRTDYRADTMTLLLNYDSRLKPVPADPDTPDIPKAVIDQRMTPDAAPHRELFEFSDRPSQSMLVIASLRSFQRCRITVWFEVPADAEAGTQYALTPKIHLLYNDVGKTLSASLTAGTLTVTDQPAVTTTATASPVKPAFDITADHLDLTHVENDTNWNIDPVWGYWCHWIAYTASGDLDYVEWTADNERIHVRDGGMITDFVFREDNDWVSGTITGTAHFLDGTVLTDTVSVYAECRSHLLTDEELEDIGIGPVVVVTVPLETQPSLTTATTAKAVTTTAAATTLPKENVTTTKATTTTTKATTTTTKATTTTTKATTTTTKATTTTTKATTTTTKATTTTTKATTTTTKATTTTTKATTTTTKATTTTTKATTTTSATTTAAITTTTAAVTTTAPPEPEVLKGDVDNNGAVSVEDAQLALKAYTRRIAGSDMGLTERQYQAANVNGDGELSVDDAQFILIYYVNNTVSGNVLTWDELLSRKPKTQQLPFPLRLREDLRAVIDRDSAEARTK